MSHSHCSCVTTHFCDLLQPFSQVATLGNLALCLSQLTEYAAAVAVCDKALE